VLDFENVNLNAKRSYILKYILSYKESIHVYKDLYMYIVLVFGKTSFTLSRFSVPASLRCGRRGPPGPHRSAEGKHRIELGYTVLNSRSPGMGPGGFKYFKTTEDSRDCETMPANSP